MATPKELFDYRTGDGEQMFIKHFTKLNDFPDYETATKIILDDKQIPMDMYAEYGELNHRLMLEAYGNFDNKDKLNKIGELIDRRGGHQAMAMNYYTLNRICIYLLKQSDIKYSDYECLLVSNINRTYLSSAWDGVGTWRG